MKPLALVIENDAGTRKLLDVLLSRLGMKVDLVMTGTDAQIILQHVEYDVLLMDLLLPGKTGRELLEWLEQHRPHMPARVVVVSSSTPAQLEAVRERWPAVRTIRKPFELGEIVEVTQEIAASRTPRALSAEEQFCRHSMRGGAKAGVIVGVNGTSLEPLLSYGYEPEILDHFFPMSLDAPYPLCATLRHSKPLWIASVLSAAPEYPTLAAVWEKNESRAIASIPIFDSGGRLVAAAGWSFREPRLFSDAEQQVFTEIAAAVPDWLGLRDRRPAASASA